MTKTMNKTINKLSTFYNYKSRTKSTSSFLLS
nr:MAG TPA: hypothetical protein [Caudoviricetes sp.]